MVTVLKLPPARPPWWLAAVASRPGAIRVKGARRAGRHLTDDAPGRAAPAAVA
jgi:hypothetical protein